MLIGLTGQIGAGKTAVAAIMKSHGAAIVDADDIGHQVVKRYPTLLKALVDAFGKDILTRSGALNRSKLARLAFADAASIRTLNRLVHPYLLRDLKKQMSLARRSAEVVVIDAALLHYWKLDREVDLTIVVYAPRALRISRMERRRISRSDMLSRQRAQVPFAEMKRRSDIVMPNSGSLVELRRRTTTLWSRRVAKAIDR